jgi:hypothetical protein
MGIMLFVGNTFFAHQAIRMKKANDGREFTAQPYGLNTVGGYPFVFGIAAAVMFSTTADEIDECAAALIADGGQQACDNGKFTLAWEVTVSAACWTVPHLHHRMDSCLHPRTVARTTVTATANC